MCERPKGAHVGKSFEESAMENIIAMDVASEVTCVYAVNALGKMIFEGSVPTEIPAFRDIIRRVPRRRTVVFEECCQADWLWSELEPLCDDVLVCDPRANKQRGQKSDRIDARKLAERARLGALSRVWHAGKELQDLRQAVFSYRSLTAHSIRLKNQVKGVFRSRGLRGGSAAYQPETRAKAIAKLPTRTSCLRAERLARILDVVSEQRHTALNDMIKLARQRPRYRELRTIEGIGPKFAAFLVATLGDASRFRTRKQLWAYSGLAVVTHDSGEYEVVDGKIRRKKRLIQTRGLVRSYNRTLKYVFKQVAMTLSRTKWKEYYDSLLVRSKNANNVQLTLARKVAAIVLHVAKTGERYDVKKAFKKQ